MKSTGQLLVLAENIRSEGEAFGFRRGETILGLDKGLPQHEWNTVLNAINLAIGYVRKLEEAFGSLSNPEIPERFLDIAASDWGCIEGHLKVYELGMKPFRFPTVLVSKTYRVVTDESAAEADNAEAGFLFEEEPYSLEECIDLINDSGAWLTSCSEFVPWVSYETPNAEIDLDTGDRTYYAFHLQGSKVALRRVWDAIIGR